MERGSVESQAEARNPKWLAPVGTTALVLAITAVLIIGFRDKLVARAEIDQPIAFSHKLHAGDKQIPCQYCHAYARSSAVAGVPSVQTCMGCHQLIAARQPEVRRIAAFWQQRQPIPWVKIHNLPDFVYFSHKRHVRAGVACQECHGPVETMDVVKQVSSLEMGWCIDCHSQRIARVPDPEERLLTQQRMLDCATCHK